jgi:hypothetical protein
MLVFLFGFLSWLSFSKEMRYWLLIHFFFFLLDVIIIAMVGWICKTVAAANITNSHVCSSWDTMSNSTRSSIERDFDCCGCIPRNTSTPGIAALCPDPRQLNCELAIDSRLSSYLYIFGDIAYALAALLAVFILWALFAIRSALSHRQAEQDRFLPRTAIHFRHYFICSVSFSHSSSLGVCRRLTPDVSPPALGRFDRESLLGSSADLRGFPRL